MYYAYDIFKQLVFWNRTTNLNRKIVKATAGGFKYIKLYIYIPEPYLFSGRMTMDIPNIIISSNMDVIVYFDFPSATNAV